MCSLSTAVHLQGEKTSSNWLSLQKACWHCSVPVISSCLSQPYSPSTDPLEIPSASLQLSFSSPAVLLVTQLCLCSPWMSDSPCTAGTEPIKGLDCKVPTEKSPLQTHRHWVPLAWLWESPLHSSVPSLSLGLLFLPQPTPLCSPPVSLTPKWNDIQIHTSSSQEGTEGLSKQLVPGELRVRASR